VTEVERAARVVVEAVATATALVVGVGTVLAVDDRRRKASDLTTPSPRSFPPSATQSARSRPKAPSVSQPAPLLLPNMRSLSASDLHIEVVGDSRRLQFAASTANLGPGPLFLLPRGRGDCPSGQHEAVQLLHRDVNHDGVFQRHRDREGYRRVTGSMLRHPGHKHRHFDAMAAYSLRRAGSSRVLVARDKVSLCLRDKPQGAWLQGGRPTTALR
jgi:hypothetical protein